MIALRRNEFYDAAPNAIFIGLSMVPLIVRRTFLCLLLCNLCIGITLIRVTFPKLFSFVIYTATYPIYTVRIDIIKTKNVIDLAKKIKHTYVSNSFFLNPRYPRCLRSI